MKNGGTFRKLVELIFQKETEIAHAQSTPTCLLTRSFSERMQGVLYVKKKIAACRWRKFFDTCFKKMLSSHEMYLTFVLFACNGEHECHQHIFESFISVCGLVKHLSEEILEKTGLDFCDLNPDIVKVFYRRRLKRMFCTRRGIQLLVEYISDHRYLTWKLNEDSSVSPDDPTALAKAIESQMDKKLEEETERYRVTEKETNPDEVANDARNIHLAKKVLSITLVEFPPLPTYPELLRRMIEYRLNKMENIEEKRITDAAEKLEILNRDLSECSSSNSESKTDCVATHQETIGQYEKIIQAVIIHNHSKSSEHENPYNQIWEKAVRVLERLKNTIKSVIEVLDEYDTE